MGLIHGSGQNMFRIVRHTLCSRHCVSSNVRRRWQHQSFVRHGVLLKNAARNPHHVGGENDVRQYGLKLTAAVPGLLSIIHFAIR
jgi:hypothetical protein